MHPLRRPFTIILALTLATLTACISYKPIQPESLENAALYNYEPALPYLRVAFAPIPASSGGKLYPGVEFASLALRKQNRSKSSNIKLTDYLVDLATAQGELWYGPDGLKRPTHIHPPRANAAGASDRAFDLVLSIDPVVFAFVVMADNERSIHARDLRDRSNTSRAYLPGRYARENGSINDGAVGSHGELFQWSDIFASHMTLPDEISECDIYFAPSKSRLDELQRIAAYRKIYPDPAITTWQRSIEIPSEKPLTLHLTRDDAANTVTFHLVAEPPEP